MTQTERDARWSIVVAYAWAWADQHQMPYMCAPFWQYARALGVLA